MFSLWYTNEYLKKNIMANLLSYIEACEKVKELISVDANAIKKLRNIEPSFYKMNSKTFIQAGVNVSEGLRNELISKFMR